MGKGSRAPSLFCPASDAATGNGTDRAAQPGRLRRSGLPGAL
ncbi:hypothetical protein DESPIGER_2335 [Desulfovibrio piger]|uniref:Uncharacterized protein n=1 Tax=Desulfovibrio piger TaxID=901 RepID=A0A1K1LHG8_9BACT|nr:hypothetical protein DESPIGER_2335 [Desulfovibrio piger]